MEKEKDYLLIEGVKNGDKKSEEKFYKKYRTLLKKYVKYKCNSSNDDIDDNVSEILIKVFQKIPLYDKNKSSFNTWVITIAKNHMIDQSRKVTTTYSNIDFNAVNTFNTSSYLTSSISMDCNTTFTNCSGFNLDTTFENNDTLNFISNKIGVKDFHLLNMKYSEGYDYNEMGKEMGVSSTTISNRINYVKGKLKKGE
jgi:RNA polymerase sigma factor (sigma-70 family)